MTTLSWLIYAVYVGSVFRPFLGFLFVVSVIAVMVRCFAVFIEDLDTKRGYEWFPKWTIILPTFLLILLGIAALIPDMTTALAIAGVELGTEAINSEYFQDFIKEYGEISNDS